MARAIVLMLDSLGIGAAPDAARFGDDGANTLGHIAASRPLKLPNLTRLGLGRAAALATGTAPAGMGGGPAQGLVAACAETSLGKDTPSGHWEMAGVPVTFDWGYFPKSEPCFPADLTEALIAEAGLPGVIGNKHASGTAILDELGEDHIATGKPIVYTSADSVFQIAAHETHFGLERLYALCRIARRLVDPMNVGRVIARPFVGEKAGAFDRTGNRKDYAVPPPAPTLLDHVGAAGGEVISVGKIGDIYAHQGTGREVKATGNEALFDATLAAMEAAGAGALIFTNFVDFDTLYGHRRDVAGYAGALEAFDARLPELEARMRPGDLAVMTADHGCDPTWPGSDHTREYVPAVFFGPGVAPGERGRRDSFADIGQTLARHLGCAPLAAGESLL